MPSSKGPTRPPFTIFRSAADEAHSKVEQENWDNEGGHMSSTGGRVVRTPGCYLPYKAVLTHGVGECTERPFGTMREAEAFIRRNTPLPIARSTLRDRAAGEGLAPTPLRGVSA